MNGNWLRIALVAGAASCLGACLTTNSDNPNRVQTTTDAERHDLGSAAEAPLHDFNVVRTKIPQPLLEALADPYGRPPGRLNCEDIDVMLTPLNDALGADLDEPPRSPDDLLHRSKGFTLGAAATAASSAIPFRGWIRKLSGAEQHDKYVQDAITAGAVRRAYLKGLGEAKSCPPPATPSHIKSGAPLLDQSIHPRYPTRLPATPPPPPTPAPDIPTERAQAAPR
jgi:hypothetical protein